MAQTAHTRYWIMILVILLSAFTLPLFGRGIPASHDGEAIIARFAAYDKAFSDGHIPPRWAGDLNYRYGTPVFTFFYPLPGYAATALAVFRFPYETRYKILMIASFVLCGVTFFWWMKRHVPETYAFLGGVLYGLLPYHFLNLFVRGALGELMALAIAPLIFLSADIMNQRLTSRSFAALSGTVALLILSHNGISLMFIPVLLLYILSTTTSLRKSITSFAAVCFGFGLSAWFWLPALVEQKYTHAALYIGEMYQEHFLTPFQLIWSPWGLHADVTRANGLSPQLGILPVGLFTLTLFVWYGTKKFHRTGFLFLVCTILTLILMLPLSQPIWNLLPLLQKLQFPWRFMALSSFAAVCFITLMLPHISGRLALWIVFPLACLFSIPSAITLPPYMTHSDAYYTSYTGPTNFFGESSTVWSAGNPSAYAEYSLQAVEGKAVVQETYRSTIEHRYAVTVISPAKFIESTLYYPGWTVTTNTRPVPVEFQDPAARGLITFTLTEGTHDVVLTFRETKFRTLTNVISLASAGTWCMMVGIGILRQRRIHGTT